MGEAVSRVHSGEVSIIGVKIPRAVTTGYGFAEPVTIHPGHEERLTRKEWSKQYFDAVEKVVAAHDALPCNLFVNRREDGRYEAAVSMTAKRDADDILTALEALAAASQPQPCPCQEAGWNPNARGGYWAWVSRQGRKLARDPGEACPDCNEPLPPAPRKDPDAMTPEECEAEIDATEGVELHKARRGGGSLSVVKYAITRGRELVYASNWASQPFAASSALRALRAHLATQGHRRDDRGGVSLVVQAQEAEQAAQEADGDE